MLKVKQNTIIDVILCLFCGKYDHNIFKSGMALTANALAGNKTQKIANVYVFAARLNINGEIKYIKAHAFITF